MKNQISSSQIIFESLGIEVESAASRLAVLEDKFSMFDADTKNTQSSMRFEHHWTVTWAGAKIIEEVLLRKKLSN